MILDHFQNSVKKSGMFSFPTSGFFELPAVNNVTVEDEIFAAVLLEKVGDFFGFGTFGTEVDVRDDDSFEGSIHSIRFDGKLDR
jgi:hypothetical protein